MAYENLKKVIPEEGSRCKQNCGRCCVNAAPVSRSEAEEIFDWLAANSTYEAIEAQFQYADTQPGKCPFLKPDKSCFVYPARPFVCRYFGHGADPGMSMLEALKQKCLKESSSPRYISRSSERPASMVGSTKRRRFTS